MAYSAKKTIVKGVAPLSAILLAVVLKMMALPLSTETLLELSVVAYGAYVALANYLKNHIAVKPVEKK